MVVKISTKSTFSSLFNVLKFVNCNNHVREQRLPVERMGP